MRPESLRMLQQAVRINPSATLRAIVTNRPKSKDELAEALIDVYTHGGPRTWSVVGWSAVTDELDYDTRTLAEFMGSAHVRALIRAQEATHE